MNIFEKLMLARQLSFTEGEIDLMGQRVVITPSNLFSNYLLEINNDPKLVKLLYKSAKASTAVSEGFAVGVGKMYGFTFKDYSQWFIDLNGLSGWGKARWIELDSDSKKGVIGITGSPVASHLKGKVDKACDHVIRGLMAGVASSAFKLDVDMIEVECEATGARECKFVLGKLDTLRDKFGAVCEYQIGE